MADRPRCQLIHGPRHPSVDTKKTFVLLIGPACTIAHHPHLLTYSLEAIQQLHTDEEYVVGEGDQRQFAHHLVNAGAELTEHDKVISILLPLALAQVLVLVLEQTLVEASHVPRERNANEYDEQVRIRPEEGGDGETEPSEHRLGDVVVDGGSQWLELTCEYLVGEIVGVGTLSHEADHGEQRQNVL